ncbi:hypothetical protein [uncultured Megamonas sp.]|uniref:hypothetical protein n=1 Tax=uncultured Megamonas sp. TaxID=286140 RepID=UPI0025E2F9A8|nr:hypothetical protein [uncultured Megamonas sp.]
MNNELLLNALKTAYNNENIRLKLNSAKDYDELALILQQENIIQCTAKDLSNLMSNMKNNELSDYQLDNIVGGIAGIDDFITWLMKKTKQFIQKL